jgi:hypothetical protein
VYRVRKPGFGFRAHRGCTLVPGFGFRVSGFGFRVSGSRFRVSGEYRVRKLAGALRHPVILAQELRLDVGLARISVIVVRNGSNVVVLARGGGIFRNGSNVIVLLARAKRLFGGLATRGEPLERGLGVRVYG